MPRLLPPAEEGWRFVQACRFVEKKGLMTTVRAFAEISRSFPGAELILIGDGPLASPMQALARSLGVADRVRFLGAVGDGELGASGGGGTAVGIGEKVGLGNAGAPRIDIGRDLRSPCAFGIEKHVEHAGIADELQLARVALGQIDAR